MARDVYGPASFHSQIVCTSAFEATDATKKLKKKKSKSKDR